MIHHRESLVCWAVAGLVWAGAQAAAYAQSPAAAPTEPLTTAVLTEYALQYSGDAVRGKALFADEARVACIKCHTTDGHGVKAGPDRAAIADKFPRRELIRTLLEPSATVAVGYGTTVIETKDDEEFQGVIKQATSEWIELVGGDGRAVRIAMCNIKDQRTTDLSLMPEGYETVLTSQQFADVIAYLETLHQPTESLTRVQGMPEKFAPAGRNAGLQPFFDAQVQLNHPLWFGAVPGFPNRFVVLEHGGKSWLIERTATGDQQTLLVDLSGQVRVGGATGLLGIAFHPKFAENRKYYLKYQILRDRQIFTQLIERQFTADFKGDAGVAPRLLLEIGSVTQDHHGGSIVFEPGGFVRAGQRR